LLITEFRFEATLCRTKLTDAGQFKCSRGPRLGRCFKFTVTPPFFQLSQWIIRSHPLLLPYVWRLKIGSALFFFIQSTGGVFGGRAG